MNKKIFGLIFILFLLIPLVSSFDWDNIKDVKETNGLAGYKDIDIYNSWIIPNVIKGDILWSGSLDSNTQDCRTDCESIQTIILYERGILIKEVIYERIYSDDSRERTNIKSSKISLKNNLQPYQMEDYKYQCIETGENYPNGTEISVCSINKIGEYTEYPFEWINYELGTELDPGIYEVKLEGRKNPSWSVDWIYKTQGITLSEWAIWGNISEGDEAEVLLISPEDNFESPTANVTFSCSANVTNGADITNVSWWENSTGVFLLNETRIINVPQNSTHGFVLDTSTVDTTKSGVVINSSEATQISAVIKDSSADATVAYIQTAYASGILANATFIGNLATFNPPIEIDADTQYWILVDDAGASFTARHKQAISLPVVDGRISWDLGVNNVGATGSDQVWDIINISTGNTGNFTIQNFNKNISSTFDWTCSAGDSDGDFGFAIENRTVGLDTTPPTIVINNPEILEGFGLFEGNQTLNFTITDGGLDSCFFDYNDTNTSFSCISGITNTTSFVLTDQRNITVYANDSLGNINSTFREWEYVIFQTNQSFDNVTFSGAEETFTLDFTLGDGFSISGAVMDYNGTNYTSNIISIENGTRLSNTINVPIVSDDTNFTFKFLITVNGNIIETGTLTQLVSQLNITDCSVGGTVILNMSLFDEKLKTNITGDIEINVQAIDKSSLAEAGFTNLTFNDTHSASICLSLVEALDSLFLDAEIKYLSEGYVSELYHIQRADLSDAPIILNLFDLNSNESTEFLVTYQDDNLIFVEDAVLQLQRKYISEDLFEVVEAPLTSDGGTAIVHIDLDTNKYKVTIVKNGVVLDIFDNIVFSCESELSGQCSQKLFGQIDPQNDIDVENLIDFAIAITQSNDTITTLFSIPSGVPSSINVLMTQTDQFNNTNTCNETVFSSAGAIECTIIPTIGDSFLDLSIKKSGEIKSQKSYIVQEDFMLDFAGNNYFILFILMLSVIGMAFTSPEWIIINAVITMVLAGALYLATGVNFVVGLGNLIWLIIAAVILIFKISHQEDR